MKGLFHYNRRIDLEVLLIKYAYLSSAKVCWKAHEFRNCFLGDAQSQMPYMQDRINCFEICFSQNNALSNACVRVCLEMDACVRACVRVCVCLKNRD